MSVSVKFSVVVGSRGRKFTVVNPSEIVDVTIRHNSHGEDRRAVQLSFVGDRMYPGRGISALTGAHMPAAGQRLSCLYGCGFALDADPLRVVRLCTPIFGSGHKEKGDQLEDWWTGRLVCELPAVGFTSSSCLILSSPSPRRQPKIGGQFRIRL